MSISCTQRIGSYGQLTCLITQPSRMIVGDELVHDFFLMMLDWRSIVELPSTSTSIWVRRKQSRASSGLQTTGSFSLNEVLSTIGTPVSSRNASIRR